MSKVWGAAGLGGLSLFMLLGFLGADIAFGAPAVIAFLLTVGLPAAGAGLLLRAHVRERHLVADKRDEIRLQTIQSEILRLATRKGGKLTVPEVMAELAVDKSTAEAALGSLHVHELAEIELTEAGMIVYAFPEIRQLGEKDDAKGLLDA
jgi:hypothetical protein